MTVIPVADMKCAIILFLAIGAVLTAPPTKEGAWDEFVRGNHKLTANIYKELTEAGQDNVIVSPFSANTVLSMTGEGARGDTAQEIVEGLSLPSSTDRTHRAFKEFLPQMRGTEDSLKMLSANKIYVGKDVELEDSFETISKDVYNSGAENVDFSNNVEAAYIINKWVADQTNNKILDLVKSDSIGPSIKVVLVNALYFSGEWSSHFSYENTKKKSFFTSGEAAVEVDMMWMIGNFHYYENPTLNAKFLEMPFNGNSISMVIALPNEKDGLANLGKNIEAVLASKPSNYHVVDIEMPRFKVETEIEMTPILRKLGIKKLFGSEADLSGISSTDKNLFISSVIHKAFINVNETGTEAAAATIDPAPIGPVPPQPTADLKTFHVDHSFLFWIEMNGIPLFIGQKTTF